MNISIRWLARAAVIASALVNLGATRTLAAQDADVIVAAGTLDDRFPAGPLFHVGEFWMRVPSGTEFNRWLSQGMHRKVIIRLVTSPDRLADEKNTRILSGTLMHQTAPTPTPNTIDVVGRLPRGDLSILHTLFLKDELTGGYNAITFETADFDTARKFDAYDDAHINIVIQIE